MLIGFSYKLDFYNKGRGSKVDNLLETKSNNENIKIWKQKLLDLSKKNNLVNYKDTKSSTLEIVYPNLNDVFNLINSNSPIQIFDEKDYDYDEDYEDEEDQPKRYNKKNFISIYKFKVSNKQLLVYNAFSKSKKILKSLVKKTTDCLNERGVNILYIAFGFLKYKDSNESNFEYEAPILMMPIKINNASINEPYYIQQFDDVIFNTTLQYMLNEQFGIVIPNYDDNMPIENFLNDISQKVANLGWEVIHEAKISTFSFNKLNMYLDLEKNAEKILNNPNVAALTKSEINKEPIFFNEEELDELSKSRDLFLKQHNVVEADFSQTEAIEYAMKGKSFVLQGPPGTGKSQTITNMIAELIYAGKKVLFVSEKMAALEVVYNNLKKVNLGDYCLQLHSYKANKKDFVKDLYETLEKSKMHLKSEANENLDSLKQITNQLNTYNVELHKIYQPINMSLFNLIGIVNHLSKTKDVNYIIENISDYSAKDLEENIKLLEQYADSEKIIGYNYKNHPLYGLVIRDSSYSFKLQLEQFFEKYCKEATNVINIASNVEKTYSVSLKNNCEISNFINLITFCNKNELLNKEFLNINKIDEIINHFTDLQELNEKILNANKAIDEKYFKTVYELDLNNIYNDFRIFGSSFFKRLFNSNYKLAKVKLLETKKRKKVKHYEAIKDLDVLIKREKALENFEVKIQMLKEKNIPYLNGINTKWDELNKLFIDLKQLIINNQKNINSLIFQEHNMSLINTLSNSYDSFKQTENSFISYFDKDILDLEQKDLADKKEKIRNYKDNLDANIDSWVNFVMLNDKLKERKLLNFVDKTIDYNYPLNKIADYYKYCFYRQWVDYILNSNPNLKNYNRFSHEDDIKKFSKNDKFQLDISKAEINVKLSSMRPDSMLQMPNSPAQMIKSEALKTKRQKPIRLLMKEISTFIQEIKPCFLMSPLSVSTFLPDDINFDVTIFDEASQVFPEDAIVAIYRSKQLIVVGDSKQMPPTKFFMTNDVDDEEYDEESSDVDAYESILDLCSTTFPTKSLSCHYRSKDENLINFSNINFYNSNLITYPSVFQKKEDFGVDFIYVENGIMDSKTKTNIREAEKVVDLIFEHFQNHPDRSLGVVASNIKQQDAILRLLDKRREIDPSFEEYFKYDKNEPFFVKNIETVQGDERDTIIYSITYGKNANGQFALRFGPLNLLGGERRLNVVITRAKLNIKVVSSIKATDIDISKVKHDGPKLLHDYLDYAEHGAIALKRKLDVNNSLEFDSPFEQDVCEFLKEKGFDVTTQVGCSKYRIDLGLKRKGTSDYVLAIECDGATYHSSKSARDRDRLRQSILEKMGWKFYRIWSVDWYKNNIIEKKNLVEACNDALNSNETYDFETNQKQKKNDMSEIVLIETDKSSNHNEIYDKFKKYNGTIISNPIYMTEVFTEIEGPISEEYLLKKICFKCFNSDKVTAKVRTLFNESFYPKFVIRENGFLYVGNQKNYAMRKKLGIYFENIDFISDYEIRNGMYAAIDANFQCKKDDLFTCVRENLGFSRTGNKIVAKFESAFKLLKPYIIIDNNGYIMINKNNKLNIIRRQ